MVIYFHKIPVSSFIYFSFTSEIKPLILWFGEWGGGLELTEPQELKNIYNNVLPNKAIFLVNSSSSQGKIPNLLSLFKTNQIKDETKINFYGISFFRTNNNWWSNKRKEKKNIVVCGKQDLSQ